ncbi:MAG: hypothetical protein ACREQ4_01545, partial [Candidatus Binataceae bacterium]
MVRVLWKLTFAAPVLLLALTLGSYSAAVAGGSTNTNCTPSNMQKLANALPYPVSIVAVSPTVVTGTTIAFCDVFGKITT